MKAPFDISGDLNTPVSAGPGSEFGGALARLIRARDALRSGRASCSKASRVANGSAAIPSSASAMRSTCGSIAAL